MITGTRLVMYPVPNMLAEVKECDANLKVHVAVLIISGAHVSVYAALPSRLVKEAQRRTHQDFSHEYTPLLLQSVPSL
jgi:hypothetical protein